MAKNPMIDDAGRLQYPKWLWIDPVNRVPLTNSSGVHLMADNPMEESQLFEQFGPKSDDKKEDKKTKWPNT